MRSVDLRKTGDGLPPAGTRASIAGLPRFRMVLYSIHGRFVLPDQIAPYDKRPSSAEAEQQRRLKSASRFLSQGFESFVAEFAHNRPPSGRDYRRWARQVEKHGNALLSSLGQVPGHMLHFDGLKAAVFMPAMEMLDAGDEQLEAIARQAFGEPRPSAYDCAMRGYAAVQLLIAYAKGTADYWTKRAKPGAHALTGEQGLVAHLAQAYERLTGKAPTVATDHDSGAKHGEALDFIRAMLTIAADRMAEGATFGRGEYPPGKLVVEPPSGFTATDIVQRLRSLIASPGALAARLERVRAIEGRPRGRPPKGAATGLRKPQD